MSIKIMVSGLPGNMASVFYRHAILEEEFEVLPFSITGPMITSKELAINGNKIKLIRVTETKKKNDIIKKFKPFIAIDYTLPNAVDDNIKFYCKNDISFVMGTTGVNIKRAAKLIENSNINAVIAPNMGKQIVALQAMLEYLAVTFPNCFSGFKLEIIESHQFGKTDTSGTALSMLNIFERLGAKLEGSIEKIRDPKIQLEMGIPENVLGGHGWHTYKLSYGKDKNVAINLEHNINGRDIYARGTIDSIKFLNKMNSQGNSGCLYNMIDVLKDLKL
nr:dihydrodipicolinate reductase [Desulfobacula sp.]